MLLRSICNGRDDEELATAIRGLREEVDGPRGGEVVVTLRRRGRGVDIFDALTTLHGHFHFRRNDIGVRGRLGAFLQGSIL
jgi:hypothetical protein